MQLTALRGAIGLKNFLIIRILQLQQVTRKIALTTKKKSNCN
ncbi:hypothetical protein BRADI_4g24573v3 [Brachypodium distachyon]|uniref:Uncharacterized protein n=1 Tax=Brachypodium distachyon TaxID=15368 RepID=A0A2K2CQ10_BRADI|nr:hypothetical protein BRADI_4g24573v3 [Brachypodium distachyon]